MPKNLKMVFSIAISGGIAAGKSTILDELKKRFACDHKIAFVNEPIDKVMSITCSNGKSLFDNFVAQVGEERKCVLGAPNYALLFQHAMMVNRALGIGLALADSNVEVLIMERSIVDDRQIFCDMLEKRGHLDADELSAIDGWHVLFDAVASCWKPHFHVVIEATLETCIDRIKIRNRDGEQYHVDYLKALGLHHEKLANEEVLAIKFDNNVARDSCAWEDGIEKLCCTINCCKKVELLRNK